MATVARMRLFGNAHGVNGGTGAVNDGSSDFQLPANPSVIVRSTSADDVRFPQLITLDLQFVALPLPEAAQRMLGSTT